MSTNESVIYRAIREELSGCMPSVLAVIARRCRTEVLYSYLMSSRKPPIDRWLRKGSKALRTVRS